MGYETCLLFVSNWKKGFTGYCSIEASLEMGKCSGYDAISELMEKAQAKHTKKETAALKSLIAEHEHGHKSMFTEEGNYTPEYAAMNEKFAQKAYNELIAKPAKALEKRLPYVMWYSHSIEEYEDSYGDLLMVVTLDECRAAMLKALAQSMGKDDYPGDKDVIPGYRRFHMALKLIEAFDPKIWGEKDVRVMLYGH